MSPEQVRSSKDVDGRADIWSLGVILYELVTGAPPFLGTTTAAIAAIVADATPRPREVRPEVPEGLERAILTALAKCPQDRFPHAEALAAALTPYASAEGIAGPFSLRPSQEAFEIASSTMARVPAGRHASDASDLLKLPTSRTTRRVTRERAPASDALRTFVGSLAIGVALATGAAIGAHHASAAARASALQAAPAQTSASLEPARVDPPQPAAPQSADAMVAQAADTLADTAPPHALDAQRRTGDDSAPSAAPHGAGLAAAGAKPRPAAPPGVPLAAPHATTNVSPQHGRTTPPHAPIERPLYL
jgi:serine/threonine-protein kinase